VGTLTYNEKTFLLDGKLFTIISGAMHYFRIPREYWHDRLLKLKECGFNTVETYTPWNLHEEHEGQFNFDGMLDVAAYAAEAQKVGLYMILRPGPYICSEWEFGGLPAWLLAYDKMPIRCNCPEYLEKVKRYYHALFAQLRPHLSCNGGNIFMVQIENEYGSFGNDGDYLRAVDQIYRDEGVDVLTYTSDGPSAYLLSGGTLPDRLCVANFGSNPKGAFAELEQFRPNQPKMCGEYWVGWFDHWYEQHHVRDGKEVAGLFRDMLDCDASLNFYMFHGGTNFGFMNGANFDNNTYCPTVTSYDYCAPLTEAGDLTDTYFEIRKTIEERFGKLPPVTAKNSPKAAYGKVRLTESCSLLDAAPRMTDKIVGPVPLFQEDLGQNFGFTLYTATLHSMYDNQMLDYDAANDRVVVWLDGKRAGLIERDRRRDEIRVNSKIGQTVQFAALCENMGRINYGPQMMDRKGMTGIRFGQQKHFSWETYALEMTKEQLARVPYQPHNGGVSDATFLRGTLTVQGTPADTFIRLDGFHHGFVAVNGFNLGRYYNDAGPQKTLYCPAPMLHAGDNEIVVFETDGCADAVVTFTDTPELG